MKHLVSHTHGPQPGSFWPSSEVSPILLLEDGNVQGKISHKLFQPYVLLLDKAEQEKRLGQMKRICQSCHASTWTDGHFAKFHSTIQEADKMTLAATKLLLQAWEKGIADKSNPFDEWIEQKWIKQWLYYANSLRYASAMSGPDFAAFKNGWFELSRNLQDMKDYIDIKSKSTSKE